MWIARARSLMGTVVSIHAQPCGGDVQGVDHAMSEAFSVMSRISHAMSAHQADSDLSRIAKAQPGEVLTLDAETVRVIRATQYWTTLSGGAFNPCGAAHTLSGRNLRPGITGDAIGSLRDITLCSSTDVRLAQPVQLDFGGIAKGYAVDRAIEILSAHGLREVLVNAGGDLRCIGEHRWPIDVRHAHETLMDGRLRQKRWIRQHALATSVAGALNPEFIFSRTHQRLKWTSVTVQAHTCIAADALTKWAMQSSLFCPGLRAALRENGGRMWRTP
jgi:FAD:protein FMN transferase